MHVNANDVNVNVNVNDPVAYRTEAVCETLLLIYIKAKRTPVIPKLLAKYNAMLKSKREDATKVRDSARRRSGKRRRAT